MKRLLAILICIITIFSLCACSDNANVTPDGMKVAGRGDGNDAVQYTFFYPEDWEIVRNSGTIELKFDCNKSTAVAEYATVSVVAFELSGSDTEMTARQYWNDKYKSEVDGLYENFEIANSDGTEITLDDSPAVQLQYSGDINEHKYYCDQVICIRYGTVYLLTLVVPNENKDQVSGVIDTIVKDFEFSDSIF